MSRKLRAKTLGGVVCVCAEPVEKGAVGIERLFDRGVEQLFLALEVVVERAHSHVGGLRELEDGSCSLRKPRNRTREWTPSASPRAIKRSRRAPSPKISPRTSGTTALAGVRGASLNTPNGKPPHRRESHHEGSGSVAGKHWDDR